MRSLAFQPIEGSVIMSRSIKGSKGPGYEYWGKRPGKGAYGGDGGSAFGKRLTHKAERQQGRRQVKDLDDKA